MKNIPFKIARICHSQFKCNYLENGKRFLNFLFHFWNLHHILNILKEKMIVIANAFPKLQTVKNLFRTLSKRRRFRAWFDSQHIKRPKNLWNLHESTFIMFFHHLVLREILGCLLTQWLVMATILFKIASICNSQLKWNYLENKNVFLIFCAIFGIYIKF